MSKSVIPAATERHERSGEPALNDSECRMRRSRMETCCARKYRSYYEAYAEPEPWTKQRPAAQRRHEKARHGSAGNADVEQIESALADGTSSVTSQVWILQALSAMKSVITILRRE
jgi:hypothetical protein